MKSLRKHGGYGLVAALALVGGCRLGPAQTPTPPDPAQAIARSLAIIRDATPAHPRVLKILFYGQSISTPKWTDQAMATLRARYPDVAFDYRNLALGGWSAKYLSRAAARDLAEAYPDLIVFHVYGDHRAYERIMRLMRAETTADVVLQTDHVIGPVEPVCDAGLHLHWSPAPGCQGHVWFKQRDWSVFMSRVWIPTMAQRYDMAMEPRTQEWQAYLGAHQLAPLALIHDIPHPNAQGWTVMADLFTSWLERQEDRAAGRAGAPGRVRSLPPPRPGVAGHYEVRRQSHRDAGRRADRWPGRGEDRRQGAGGSRRVLAEQPRVASAQCPRLAGDQAGDGRARRFTTPIAGPCASAISTRRRTGSTLP